MKALKFDTCCDMTIVELAAPLHKSLQNELNGYFETVNPKRLKQPFCMIVDEEGLLKGLPDNPVGSYLYATDEHGSRIVGDILIMKWHNGAEGIDLVGLDDQDITNLADKLKEMADVFKEIKKQNGGYL